MTCDMCGCTLFVDMWVCHSPTKSHTGGSGHSSRSEGVNIGAGENRVYKSSALWCMDGRFKTKKISPPLTPERSGSL